jgi:tRNA (cytidine/uridine-2'-O-)-methyltransferase
MLHVVLVEPEIPQNTGNIVRTCAAVGARLHLVKPLGFSVEDKYLKRAGLDYWSEADIVYHDNLAAFLDKHGQERLWFLSTKAERCYTDACYQDGDVLVFGKETAGLPEALLARRYDQSVRIPMREGIRSLNLSNAVAIVVYEAVRQQGNAALQTAGFIPPQKK